MKHRDCLAKKSKSRFGFQEWHTSSEVRYSHHDAMSTQDTIFGKDDKHTHWEHPLGVPRQIFWKTFLLIKARNLRSSQASVG